ncbi:hypothetical protein FHS10_005084 [Mucilaginibacter dorajii]|nr:hypothetical protein [Mucilaginibacter dorajii]
MIIRGLNNDTKTMKLKKQAYNYHCVGITQ